MTARKEEAGTEALRTRIREGLLLIGVFVLVSGRTMVLMLFPDGEKKGDRTW